MTRAGRRIADLEQQVADLTARVEQVAQQACVVRTLEEMRLERQGYASGRPAALAASRPRHLRWSAGARHERRHRTAKAGAELGSRPALALRHPSARHRGTGPAAPPIRREAVCCLPGRRERRPRLPAALRAAGAYVPPEPSEEARHA